MPYSSRAPRQQTEAVATEAAFSKTVGLTESSAFSRKTRKSEEKIKLVVKSEFLFEPIHGGKATRASRPVAAVRGRGRCQMDEMQDVCPATNATSTSRWDKWPIFSVPMFDRWLEAMVPFFAGSSSEWMSVGPDRGSPHLGTLAKIADP